CRTGHAFIGEYYAKFVPSESKECPCGHPHQTRAHILQDCPRHDEHRRTLTDFDPEISITRLLNEEKGMAALAEFIRLTGAYTKTGELAEP
ncbi:hypothetical protein SISSUDRAFT_970126, partial [Sistotremastrum suecicum HHB10207 ss-3]